MAKLLPGGNNKKEMMKKDARTKLAKISLLIGSIVLNVILISILVFNG